MKFSGEEEQIIHAIDGDNWSTQIAILSDYYQENEIIHRRNICRWIIDNKMEPIKCESKNTLSIVYCFDNHNFWLKEEKSRFVILCPKYAIHDCFPGLKFASPKFIFDGRIIATNSFSDYYPNWIITYGYKQHAPWLFMDLLSKIYTIGRDRVKSTSIKV